MCTLQLNVKLIFSHGIDLDVLPKGAGKGEALAFLLQKMRREGSAPQETLVCGDSGNDIELFEVEGVNGVIVSSCSCMKIAESDGELLFMLFAMLAEALA